MKGGLVYMKDYVVVPPRVWKAFVNWYGKSDVIMRKVIVFPQNLIHLRSTVHRVESKDKEEEAVVEQV